MTRKRRAEDNLLIGAHTSAAGGVHCALLEGEAIGATTVQLFTSNQRQWKGRPISEEAAGLFQETLEKTGLESIMSHAGYLINLGSPHEETRVKSVKALHEEVERCRTLGITYLNLHPGSAVGSPKEVCLTRIIEGILSVKGLFEEGELRLLLETMAGQGSALGASFEELAYLIERLHTHLPVGVCFDTCHAFAAGYDIRTEQGWRHTLETFDKVIGLPYLYAFHVNDSMKEYGSKKDRHASLGEGCIGLDSFRFLMTSSRTRALPKYLETPGGPSVWDKEIWMLREFARGKA